MIDEVHIKNFALIENCVLHFKEGFNVLSGETGAGKSLMASSLALLRGARGNTETVRAGAVECEISGYFYTENREAVEWLSAKGIVPDGSSVLIKRTLKKNGRGSIQIQGVCVTREELSEFASMIFDIHGQHEQYTLVNSLSQQDLLDSYAGLREKLGELKKDFVSYTSARKEIEAIDAADRSRAREIDMLEFALNEIENAKLKEGEEEELEKRRKILADHEKLFKLAEDAFSLLSGQGETGLLPGLKTARNFLDQSSRIDESLEGLSKRLDESFYEIEDIAGSLRDYLQKDAFDPEELASCEERIFLITGLKKKYGGSIKEILKYAEQAEKNREILSNYEENREKLLKEIKILEQRIIKLSFDISEKRHQAASVLEKEIESILKELGMPKAVFKIAVEERKGENNKTVFSSSGTDTVSFMISPNKGEPLRALDRAVSGGELSRIMLAVKSAFAESDPVETVLFDEIDSGIGGEVAVQLGKYLSGLASKKQVICITHIASIAVNADNHIKVEKKTEGERTNTDAQVIEGEKKIAEIARMLSGSEKGISAEHAREMLKEKRRI